MPVHDWFLTPSQRGNPSTSLDRRHHDGSSWTAGNDVQALIHGATYFPELLRCVQAMRAGDLLLFTDWLWCEVSGHAEHSVLGTCLS